MLYQLQLMMMMEITHWLWSFELKLWTKCQKVLSYSQPRKAIPESFTFILQKVKHTILAQNVQLSNFADVKNCTLSHLWIKG